MVGCLHARNTMIEDAVGQKCSVHGGWKAKQSHGAREDNKRLNVNSKVTLHRDDPDTD